MQRPSHSFLWATIFSSLIGNECYGTQQAEQPSPERRNPDVEAIISGFRANRERFPFGRVKIVKTERFAQSIEDALARQWLDDALARQQLPEWPPSLSERLWFFDGETTRFEDTEFPDPPKSSYVSQIVLRNKHFTIRWYPDRKGGAVYPVRPRYDQPWSPFSQGLGMCESAEEDIVEFKGECEVNGRLALAFDTSSRLTGQLPNRYWDRYWVDPARGFLPVRIENSHPAIFVYEEFIQNSHDGWMPRRWVAMSPPGNAELPWRVTDYEVTEWNFDEPSRAEVFRMSVEAGEGFSFNRETFQVLGTEINLRWFKEDGSIDAPEGAIETVLPELAPMAGIWDQNQPTPWQLAGVLGISVTIGFGGLFLWDWIRRRHRAKANLNQSSRTGIPQQPV